MSVQKIKRDRVVFDPRQPLLEKKDEEPVFIEDEKDGGPESADDKPFEYNHTGLTAAEAQKRLEKLGSCAIKF